MSLDIYFLPYNITDNNTSNNATIEDFYDNITYNDDGLPF